MTATICSRLFACLLPLVLLSLSAAPRPAQAEFSQPAEAFQGMPASAAMANLPLAIETFTLLLSRPDSLFDTREAKACALSAEAARLAVLGPDTMAVLAEETRRNGMSTETLSGQLAILSGACPTDQTLSGMTEYIWRSDSRMSLSSLVTRLQSRQRGVAQYDAQGNPRTLSIIEASHSEMFQQLPSGELASTALPGQPPGQNAYSITYGRGYMGQADDIQVTFTLIDTPPAQGAGMPPLRSSVAITRYTPDGEVLEIYMNNQLRTRAHLNRARQQHGWLEFFGQGNAGARPIRQCYQSGEPAPESACARP